jgi:hypothetical protein
MHSQDTHLNLSGSEKLSISINTPEEIDLFKKIHPTLDQLCFTIFDHWLETIQENLISNKRLWSQKSKKPLLYNTFSICEIANPHAALVINSGLDFQRYKLLFLLTGMKAKEISGKFIDHTAVFPRKIAKGENQITGYFPMRIFSVSTSYNRENNTAEVAWRPEMTGIENALFSKEQGLDSIIRKTWYPEICLRIQN